MFCSKCGCNMPEGSSVCPQCGEPTSTANRVKEAAGNFFGEAESQMGSAFKDVRDTFSGNGGGGGPRLKDDRGLISYILLSIITCGIYSYYFIYQMAHDVNIACDGDGQKTSGLIQFIVLSFITCGIYTWYWYFTLGNRLASNAGRYGLNFQENGTTVIMWLIFGSLICGIGAFVAMHILIKNSNAICAAYNRKYGY